MLHFCKGREGERFALWRQDDNGNRFQIKTFPDRAGAEKMLAQMTRNTHKQIYWIADSKEAIKGGE